MHKRPAIAENPRKISGCRGQRRAEPFAFDQYLPIGRKRPVGRRDNGQIKLQPRRQHLCQRREYHRQRMTAEQQRESHHKFGAVRIEHKAHARL